MTRPDRSEPTLKLAIHGVPEQSARTMQLFFQQLSEEVSLIDTIDDADIHLVDMDYSGSYNILSKLQRDQSQCVFIITSLTDRNLDSGIIFLKKPLSKQAAQIALKKSRLQLTKQKTDAITQSPPPPVNSPSVETNNIDETSLTHPPISKQKTDKQFNEKLFSNFIGMMPEIDIDDPDQISRAAFSPKDYFFCYVYNAIKTAHQKGLILEINAGWKPLIVFPHSQEIWLDATDHQLRAFANLKINSSPENRISFTTVNIKDLPGNKQDEKFQSEQSLLWKLALWTSKGHYPSNIDPEKPIILKHWPNLTRLVVTPHALRICALLIKQPQSMLDVAKTLNIGPQYVFAFITACSALNLIAQVDKPPARKQSATKKNNSLLSKILSKLRTQTNDDST